MAGRGARKRKAFTKITACGWESVSGSFPYRPTSGALMRRDKTAGFFLFLRLKGGKGGAEARLKPFPKIIRFFSIVVCVI
jgi:hypothetical protein